VAGRRAVDGVSARVSGEGVTCIVGPSGSGKSTLLRLCNRLMVPTSGRVLFRDDDVAGLDPLPLRRRVGMVFQRPTPFAGTVRENLRVALPEGTDEEFEAALRQAALDGSFLDRDATRLSGGEAQRMCLARTLVTEPEVLLMDEPTSALDEETGVELERLACDRAEEGLPVLWVTHDRRQVDRIADHVLRMEAGRVVP
jgi:putative ABC transport system ATP-binding protein